MSIAPARKAGSASSRRWKPTLVATPAITSSSSARTIRSMASGAVGAHTMSLASRES